MQPDPTLSMAIKLAWHELRHGWKHFSVFVMCLMLGVTIMASVGSIGHMIAEALESEAQSLLGGDIEVRTRGIRATSEQRQFLESLGTVSSVTTVRSMLDTQESSTLVEIKAVDAAYPLLGKLEVMESITPAEALAENGLIVDPILMTRLGLKLQDTVRLGEATYVIRAQLKTEPDRAVQIFNFGPRVMMSHTSLEKSGLLSAFSLAEHRYRIITKGRKASTPSAMKQQLQETLESRFPEVPWRISTGTDGNQALQRFMDQLLSFLSLSGLATFLIAGIGIGSSARTYLEKKSHTIAVFKSIGATRRTILTTYGMVLGLLALTGGLAGCAVAASVLYALLPFLTSFLPALASHQELSPAPLLLAIWYGFLIVYLFSLPALLSSLSVRPSLLFRSTRGMLPFRNDCTVRIATASLALLLLATLLADTGDAAFLLGAVAVILLAFVLFGLCTIAVRYVARRTKVQRPWLRLALGNLHRPGSTTGTVIFAIGISLTVLIALTLTEANVQSRIARLVEEKAPTLFMMDIQPHQHEALRQLLLKYTAENDLMLYPMVRGKISAINGQTVHEADIDEDIRWAVRGDRGLSTSAALPENATLTQGEWWPEDYRGSPLISVDERFIDGMNLALGDTLTLNILGEETTAKITSARRIDYTTMQINFAMMLSPGAIDDFPRTYLATVHLDASLDHETALVREVARDFPGVTVIRTAEVVSLVHRVLGYIATALRITVGISLLAGLLVLVSALGATLEQRLYDTAVLKVLGARRLDILKGCTAEWMLLALITAMIAAVVGTFGAWLISMRFRGQDFFPMPEVTLVTAIACIAVVWLTGYLGNRRLFLLRPSQLLRNE